MRSLTTVNQGSLRWVQLGSEVQGFELREGTEPLGTLRWKSACGTLAYADCADGRWTFKRVGFLNPMVTVRGGGSEADVAVFKPRLWGDGVLELQGGRTLAWNPGNFWRTEWSFSDADGGKVLGVKTETSGGWKDLFTLEGRLDFPPQAAARPEFPLLAMLGWYLLLLYKQDYESSTVVLAAIT